MTSMDRIGRMRRGVAYASRSCRIAPIALHSVRQVSHLIEVFLSRACKSFRACWSRNTAARRSICCLCDFDGSPSPFARLGSPFSGAASGALSFVGMRTPFRVKGGDESLARWAKRPRSRLGIGGVVAELIAYQAHLCLYFYTRRTIIITNCIYHERRH